jgi:DNA-binding NtrC family response regulator
MSRAIPELPQDGTDLRAMLEAVEDRMIGEALERTGGNKNRAAELLGLNRTTLVEKLRRKRVITQF